MEIVKKTSEYTIFKKKSGRFGIRSKHKSWINGDEKTSILVKEGLVKAPVKQEEAPAEDKSESSTETSDTTPVEASGQEEATN